MDQLFCCAFIQGEKRLALIKPHTISRLELQAAVIAVRMSAIIHKELGVSCRKLSRI